MSTPLLIFAYFLHIYFLYLPVSK